MMNLRANFRELNCFDNKNPISFKFVYHSFFFGRTADFLHPYYNSHQLFLTVVRSAVGDSHHGWNGGKRLNASALTNFK